MELYSDRNPKKTIKGFGYKNKKKANYTLKKLKKIKATDLYSFQVINTMYYRAKHHKNRTKDMEQAMKIFKKYLDKIKKKTKKNYPHTKRK
tara:strand:+ start:204 stop:476 length:273 start_codon:yes stop_codon:yes gene_type:complete